VIALDPHPATFLGYGDPWERLASVLSHYHSSRILVRGRAHVGSGLTATERKRRLRARMSDEDRKAQNRKHQNARRARLRAAQKGPDNR
jgi:hypothetical protein